MANKNPIKQQLVFVYSGVHKALAEAIKRELTIHGIPPNQLAFYSDSNSGGSDSEWRTQEVQPSMGMCALATPFSSEEEGSLERIKNEIRTWVGDRETNFKKENYLIAFNQTSLDQLKAIEPNWTETFKTWDWNNREYRKELEEESAKYIESKNPKDCPKLIRVVSDVLLRRWSEITETYFPINFRKLRKELIDNSLASGKEIIPFVGSGISVRSGILVSKEFLNYLRYVFFRCLLHSKATHNLSRDGWPDMPNQDEMNEARREIRKRKKLAIEDEDEEIEGTPKTENTQDEVVRIGLSHLDNWKTALHFLARLRYQGEKSCGPNFSLDSRVDPNLIAEFYEKMTAHKRCNLAHKMIAHLSHTFHTRILLSTNFDQFLEEAFGLIREKLDVHDYSVLAEFPAYSNIRWRRTLIKLYGGLPGLSADLDIITKPKDKDLNSFLSYFTKNEIILEKQNGHSGSRGIQKEKNVKPEAMADLLIVGLSARDEYVNNFIEYALKEIDGLKIFWIYHSDKTFKEICNRFGRYVLEEKIFAFQSDRPDLVLYELYYAATMSTPPLGTAFRCNLHLPPAVNAEEVNLKKDCDKIVKYINHHERIKKTALTPSTGKNLFYSLGDVSSISRYNDSKSNGRMVVITGSRSVSRLASNCFRVLSKNVGRKCLWIELDDIGSTQMLETEVLRSLGYEMGLQMSSTISSLSEEPTVKGHEWVLFFYGRACPGSDFGWEGESWTKDSYKQFWEYTLDLRQESFSIVYMPYTKGCAQRFDSKVYDEIVRDEDNASENHPSDPPQQTGEELKALCDWIGSERNDKRIWYKTRFFYALTLFRHARHPAALLSEATYPCPNPFNVEKVDNVQERAKATHEWVDQLTERKLIRRKDGGFIWFHRAIRLQLQKELEKNGLGINSGQNRGISGIKARTHHWIAEWYFQTFLATKDIFALIESLHHRYETLRAIPDSILSFHNTIRILVEGALYGIYDGCASFGDFQKKLSEERLLCNVKNILDKKLLEIMESDTDRMVVFKRVVEQQKKVFVGKKEEEIDKRLVEIKKEGNDFHSAHLLIRLQRFHEHFFDSTLEKIINTLQFAKESLSIWADQAYKSFFTNHPFNRINLCKQNWFERLKEFGLETKMKNVQEELSLVSFMIGQECGDGKIKTIWVGRESNPDQKIIKDYISDSIKSKTIDHNDLVSKYLRCGLLGIELNKRDYKAIWKQLGIVAEIFKLEPLLVNLKHENDFRSHLRAYIDQLLLEDPKPPISVIFQFLFLCAQYHASKAKLEEDMRRINKARSEGDTNLRNRWAICCAINNQLLRLPSRLEDGVRDQYAVDCAFALGMYGVALAYLDRYMEAGRRLDESSTFLSYSNSGADLVHWAIVCLRKAEYLIRRASNSENTGRQAGVYLVDAWCQLEMAERNLSDSSHSIWWWGQLYLLQLRVLEVSLDLKNIKKLTINCTLPVQIPKRAPYIFRKGLNLGDQDPLRTIRLIHSYINCMKYIEMKDTMDDDLTKCKDKLKSVKDNNFENTDLVAYCDLVDKILKRLKIIN